MLTPTTEGDDEIEHFPVEVRDQRNANRDAGGGPHIGQ
jgi:hypothetical protein